MLKVVINDCYGGFSVGDEAIKLGRELSGDPKWCEDYHTIPRHDKTLVAVVTMLGYGAGKYEYTRLTVREIEGNRYKIDEYDGLEEVIEPKDIHWVEIE